MTDNPLTFRILLFSACILRLPCQMDLKGDCATIGMVRVDEKDKKTPITMDLKGKVVCLNILFQWI